MIARHREVVLIIDDQEENIRLVGSVLTLFDYDCVAAASGAQALKRLEARTPDIILLDVRMPDMDGLEVCRHIKLNPAWADIPILFLSAADDKNLVVQALEAGGVDYLTKPFHRAELLSRVRTHLSLKDAHNRLRQLYEDKDEILGILAHDLKNGLAGIRLSAGLIAERTGEMSSKSIALAENVETTSGRLLDHIEKFLANVRLEQSRLVCQPVDFGTAIVEAIAINQPAASSKNIALLLDPPAKRVSVMADADALLQALDNLIANAVKFTPAGGRVEVAAPPPILGLAQCFIDDSGPGFSEDDRTQLFQRYQRLSARPTANEPSTGLGLSIAFRLLQRMHGELRLADGPGRLGGASFSIRLPLAMPASEAG